MSGTTTFRIYWVVWGVLLVLTLAMLMVEATEFTRALAVAFLVAAMLAKAVLIGSWFMHLRFERMTLVLPLVLGTLLTAAVLFFLIAVDGAQTARLSVE